MRLVCAADRSLQPVLSPSSFTLIASLMLLLLQAAAGTGASVCLGLRRSDSRLDCPGTNSPLLAWSVSAFTAFPLSLRESILPRQSILYSFPNGNGFYFCPLLALPGSNPHPLFFGLHSSPACLILPFPDSSSPSHNAFTSRAKPHESARAARTSRFAITLCPQVSRPSALFVVELPSLSPRCRACRSGLLPVGLFPSGAFRPPSPGTSTPHPLHLHRKRY